MALNVLEFRVDTQSTSRRLKAPVHAGIVGSGDMEILLSPRESETEVAVRIKTPVSGFDDLWRRVIDAFLARNALSGCSIEINDNNATPAVVLLRLQQALSDAEFV